MIKVLSHKNKQMKYIKCKFLVGILFILYSCQIPKTKVPEEIAPFATPFGEFNFARPEFPDTVINIIDYGAKDGGEFMNTQAINNAIRELSASGGGKVVVPAGKWLTGPVILLSNVNLHLEEEAELIFSQNFDDYLPAVLTNWEGSEVYSYSPFIYAFKQENIAITGKGVLNGQGKPWWEHRKSKAFGNDRLREMNENEVPVNERCFDNLDNYLPPVFFGPLYCKNILLEGVKFMYGAFWTINPSFCENLIVRDIYVLTEGEYGHTPNGDGINPNSCTNVLIEYNTLDTGDDCITIKSGRNKDGRRIGMPSKNILIRHNVGLRGHGGVVIGSEMSGGVENVYAHDCEFYGTDRVVRLKTGRGRGAYIKNCWFKDMKADTIEREAVRIFMLYGEYRDRLPVKDVDDGTPIIENIHIENISCNYTKRNIISIIGIPEMPVQNVSIKNVQLFGEKGIEISDAKGIQMENISVGNQKGSLVSISYSDSITINGISVKETDENEIPFIFNDATNLSMQNLVTNISGQLVSITGNSRNIEFDKSIPEKKVGIISQQD